MSYRALFVVLCTLSAVSGCGQRSAGPTEYGSSTDVVLPSTEQSHPSPLSQLPDFGVAPDGMVIGGPLNGTMLPGAEGGMVIGGPLNGTMLPPAY